MFASFQSLRKEPKRSLTVKARVTVRVLQAAKKPQKVKMSVYIDKIQEATCFLFLFSVRAGSKI